MVNLINAEDIAIQAGEYLLKNFGKSLSVKLKKDKTYVSNVDFESNKIICDKLAKLYPDHLIVSEEDPLIVGEYEKSDLIKSNKNSYNHSNCTDFVWVVDPLDGTSNFINGFAYYCVSLACVKKINEYPFFETILGVVYNPNTSNLYSCEKNYGVYLKNIASGSKKKLKKIIQKTDISKSFLSCGFHKDHLGGRYCDLYVDLIKKAESSRRLGAAALDISMVASGVFDVFFDPNVRIWDFLAAGLFVSELQGVTMHFSKKELYDNQQSKNQSSDTNTKNNKKIKDNKQKHNLKDFINTRGVICGSAELCKFVYNHFN